MRTSGLLFPALALLALAACSGSERARESAGPAPAATTSARPSVGLTFETTQTEFWVAGLDAMRARLQQANVTPVEAVAGGDGARQLRQAAELADRGVVGLVAVPKDPATAEALSKLAAERNLPLVFFNRPAATRPGRSVAVVADNLGLSRATNERLCALARQAGGRLKGAILLGDLSDPNAVERRDGFEQAMAKCGAVTVVARIPTEWNAEKAAAGLRAALKTHPDLGLVFTSSDFMLPAIAAELKAAGRWKKAGEPGHVILGGFDGDATAYRMLEDGYLDATGVQDVFFESEAAVNAVLDMRAGRPVPERIADKGFVIHAGNAPEVAPRMWGARLLQRSGAAAAR